MKTVYRVNHDSTYKSLIIKDEYHTTRLQSRCLSLEKIWYSPVVYINSSSLKMGDFYQSTNDHLIINPQGLEYLSNYLGDFGELLPLPYQGEIYAFFNV